MASLGAAAEGVKAAARAGFDAEAVVAAAASVAGAWGAVIDVPQRTKRR